MNIDAKLEQQRLKRVEKKKERVLWKIPSNHMRMVLWDPCGK